MATRSVTDTSRPRGMVYSPLPHERCTRVLRVLDCTPDATSKLHIAPTTVDLTNIDLGQPDWVDRTVSESKDEHDFDALSYTWGSPFSSAHLQEPYAAEHNATVSVDIDSVTYTTSLSVNLHHALTKIWYLGRRRYLWVDALCINQTDLIEKAQQVALMSHIYAGAAMVLVWPGTDDPDLPTMADLCTTAARLQPLYSLETVGMRQPEHKLILKINDQLDIVGLHSGSDDFSCQISAELMRSCSRFSKRRRYFSRSWILQEVALAKEAFLILGPYLWSLRKLADLESFIGVPGSQALSVFDEPDSETRGDGSELKSVLFAQLVKRCWRTALPFPEELRGFFRLHDGAHDERTNFLAHFLFLMSQGSTTNCSDDRDAVFSLLGYLNYLYPDCGHPIQADYLLSVEEVFTSVTITLLQELPHFTVFGLIHRHTMPEKHHKLPSWVPDYSQKSNFSLIETARAHCNRGQCTMTDTNSKRIPRYAAGAVVTSSRPSIEGGVLTVNAERCGFVEDVTSYPYVRVRETAPAPLTRYFEKWHTHFRDFVEFARDKTPTATGRPVLEAMFVVGCRPSPLHEFEGPNDYPNMIRRLIMYSMIMPWLQKGKGDHVAWMLKLLESTLELISTVPHEACLPDVEDLAAYRRFLDAEEPGKQLSEQDMDRLNRYTGLSSGIKFEPVESIFMLDNGFVGSTKFPIQPTDELWLLHNAKMPYILRPYVDGTYELLGEALVDGMMFGEVAGSNKCESIRAISIV